MLRKIESFLDAKKLPKDKKDLIVRTLQNTLTTDNINKPVDGESQLKRVFIKIVDDLGIYYKIGLTTDFTGKLFNEMYSWLGFTQDQLNDVVLTPSYVATFLCRLARVNKDSFVWDFATGSAGLLVAAMNEMLIDAKKRITSPEQLALKEAEIKANQLLGLEILSKPKLLSVLVRDVDKTFCALKIQLPVKNGAIDFGFMDSFVAELEAQRVAELSAYLKVSGYDNYELSSEELAALREFGNLPDENWGTYKVGDLFERVETKKLPYKAKELPKQPIDDYVLPCLTSSFQNQGLNYYAPRTGATVLNNVISIPSIVVLAEYTAAISNLIDLLHVRGVSMQQYLTTGCERIHIIGSTGLQIKPHLQTDRSSIQVIDEKTVLCCVHLNSQLYSDSSERREIDIQQVIDDILQIEKKLNTKDTIIVGDFNLNPYDSSCVSARYFHGIPIYVESIRESRTVAGKEFYMFYNPMWNFLGDFKEPYGTYYHHSANTVETYWNIFDQVIIRPSLRKRFVDNSLQILTETSTISLLDGNKHPNHDISDHLPITFEIEEDNHE